MKTASFCGKRFLAGSLVVGFSALGTGLFAQPVVDYTVTGTSGDYTLDFTVNNATPGTGNQDIYFLGVYVPNGTVSGSPSPYVVADGFDPYSFFGVGSTLTYNDGWQDPSDANVPPDPGALPPGTTLSGFTVLDTSLTAPTSIPYFAFGYGGGADYAGPGNLVPDLPTDPLFEGNAPAVKGGHGLGVADDGATMPLLAIALGALGGAFHKLRHA